MGLVRDTLTAAARHGGYSISDTTTHSGYERDLSTGETVQLAGLSVGLTAGSAHALAQLRSVLSSAPATTAAPQLTLRTGVLSMPARPADRRSQGVSWWEDGDVVTLAAGRRQVARIEGTVATLDPGELGQTGLHLLLFPALSALLARWDILVVHAAGFLVGPGRPDVPGGQGAYLAVGHSGKGKSTLVAALLGAGYEVLGDDLLALRLLGGRAQVSAIGQPLALPADLADEVGVGSPLAGDHRGRRAPAREHLPGVGWHDVVGVILLAHCDSDSGSMERASGQDVLRAVLAANWDGSTVGRAHLALPFAAAVARTPGWHLRHARLADRRARSAVGHVARIVGDQLSAAPAV